MQTLTVLACEKARENRRKTVQYEDLGTALVSGQRGHRNRREASRARRGVCASGRVRAPRAAEVVGAYDNLNFLKEIVPARVTVRKAKERKLALESGVGGVAAAAAGPTEGDEAAVQ